MSNIYDIFNSRKENLNVVCEGFELEKVVLENFEDPSIALYDIVTESNEELMELQSAMYMGDLVLESVMYECFDEEEVGELMEAAMKDRLVSLGETIKKQWAKLVAWFKQTIQNIVNFFTSGEELVKKYKNEIPKKMKASTATAKMLEYVEVGTALKRCDGMIKNVKSFGESNYESVADAKIAILKAAGSEDMAGVVKAVRAAFTQTEKPVEVKLSSLNPNIVMDYVANKKAIIDSINKNKADIDKEFQQVLNMLKSAASKSEGDAKTKAQEAVSIFQFAINVKTRIINGEIACVKKGASDNKAVIRKVLGGKSESGEEIEKVKATPEQKERLAQLKAAKQARKDAAGNVDAKLKAGKGKGGKNGFVLNSFMLEFDDIEFSDDAE